MHSKTRELRQEMVQTGQAARQWQHRNRCEGAELRHQRVINHRFRIERDNSELERKKEVVSHHQRSFRMKPRPKRGLLGEGERLSQVNWSEL